MYTKENIQKLNASATQFKCVSRVDSEVPTVAITYFLVFNCRIEGNICFLNSSQHFPGLKTQGGQ